MTADGLSSKDVAPPPRFRGRAWLLLKILISAASLYVVTRSISFAELAAVLRQAKMQWLVLALAIFWFAQLVSALRYCYVTRTLQRPIPYSLSLRLHFIGLWFNQVFPTSLGGDLVKILLVKAHIGLNYAFRTTVIERGAGLIFMLVSVLALLPLYSRVFADSRAAFLLGALCGGALAAVALLSSLGARLQPLTARFPPAQPLVGVFESLWTFRKGVPLWRQTWTSAIVHANGIASFALAGKALGLDVSLLDYVLVTPLVFLVALIPVSFAGWGLRELGSVWLFGLVGVQALQATTMSMLFGFMLIVAGLPGLILTILTSSAAKRQSISYFT